MVSSFYPTRRKTLDLLLSIYLFALVPSLLVCLVKDVKDHREMMSIESRV